MRTLIVAILALLACGCVLSDAPIRSEDGPAFDSRLAGVWRDADGGSFMHVGIKAGAGQLISVGRKKSGEVGSSEHAIITACFSAGCFLSLVFEEKEKQKDKQKENETRQYGLVKYVLSESGTLTLHHANTEFVKTAIEAGHVRGKYNDRTFGEANLHATEAELRNFVMRYADQLFSDVTEKFSRIE